MEWYYEINGQQEGPVSEAVMQSLLSQAKINRNTLVWSEGMTDWLPLSGTSLASSTPSVSLYSDSSAAFQSSPPSAGEPPPGKMRCAESGEFFDAIDMIQVGDAWVGLPYRDRYLQKLREGGGTYTYGQGGQGTTPNEAIRRKAKESITGNTGKAIGIIIVAGIVSNIAGSIPLAGIIISILIAGPLQIGMATFFLNVARGQNAEVGNLFDGFKQFGQAFAVYFLMALFVGLWSLLLVIPGIMKAFSYSMVFKIAVDHPTMGAMDALKNSSTMMNGSRMKLFKLTMNYFGWLILACFVLVIAMAVIGSNSSGNGSAGIMVLAVILVPLAIIANLVIMPRFATASAHFYDDVRGKAGL